VTVDFLNTDLPGNPRHRGSRLLRALVYKDVVRFRMNEGHAALLTLALLEEIVGRPDLASAMDHRKPNLSETVHE
jgi:hypothetical protein